MSTEEILYWAGLGFAIGRVIEVILYAALDAERALCRFIKRQIREHEHIVNEKILRGIK